MQTYLRKDVELLDAACVRGSRAVDGGRGRSIVGSRGTRENRPDGIGLGASFRRLAPRGRGEEEQQEPAFIPRAHQQRHPCTRISRRKSKRVDVRGRASSRCFAFSSARSHCETQDHPVSGFSAKRKSSQSEEKSLWGSSEVGRVVLPPSVLWSE